MKRETVCNRRSPPTSKACCRRVTVGIPPYGIGARGLLGEGGVGITHTMPIPSLSQPASGQARPDPLFDILRGLEDVVESRPRPRWAGLEWSCCLDDAIAGAVTEYGFERDRSIDEGIAGETAGVEAMARELRNSIQRTSVALGAITAGYVGIAGSTGRVLDQSLLNAEGLCDRLIA